MTTPMTSTTMMMMTTTMLPPTTTARPDDDLGNSAERVFLACTVNIFDSRYRCCCLSNVEISPRFLEF